MSFGGGGSQGTIRYALIVDDAQATQKLNTFKTSLTQLATPTANINRNLAQMGTTLKSTGTSITQNTTQINAQLAAQQKLSTVTATTGKNVATMGNQFQATTNKIKSAGPPLANLEKTSTSLGTSIKNNMSKFSGLATGLSATTSGALQLAAGFRDYNDAQIAVERVTRRLSLGQEALGKAQAKLDALNKSGSASSADLAQAQLDVSQAQKQVEIQTQLVGEAQERMFDSQSQFIASVIPTSLGAIGSLGAAFSAFGGNLTKLKGIFPALVNAFSGIASSITGVGAASSGAAGGVTAFSTALLGTVGPLAAVAGAGVIAFQAFQVNKDIVAEMTDQMDIQVDNMQVWEAAWIRIRQTFGAASKEEIARLDALELLDKKTQEMQKNIAEKIPLKSRIFGLTPADKQKILAEIKGLGADVQAEIKAIFEGTATAVDPLIQKTGELTKVTEPLNKAIAYQMRTFDDTAKSVSSYADEVAGGEVEVAKFNTTTENVNKAIAYQNGTFDDTAASVSSYADEVAAGEVEVFKAKETFDEWNKRVSESVDTQLAAARTADKYKQSLSQLTQEGLGKMDDVFNVLEESERKANEALNQYTEDWRAFAVEFNKRDLDLAKTLGLDKKIDPDKMFEDLVEDLPKSLEKRLKGALKLDLKMEATNTTVQNYITSLIDGITDAKGETFVWDANLKVDDKAATEYAENLVDFINKKTDEEELLADPNLKDLRDDLTEAIDNGADASEIADILAEHVEDAPPIKVVVVEDETSKEDVHTHLQKYMDDHPIDIPGNPVLEEEGGFPGAGFAGDLWGDKEPIEIPGKATVDDVVIGNGVDPGQAAFDANPYTATVNKVVFQDTSKIPRIERPEELIRREEERERGEIPMPEEMVLKVNNTQAIKAIDVVAKRIASLSTIPAMIKLINTTAIKATDVVAKRIFSLTGLQPSISLQNKKAIKVTDVVANRIDSLTKIKPSISLQNNKAIKAVDVVAKRINSLGDINPTVNVQVKYNGIRSFQHGGTFMTSGPELIMVGDNPGGRERVSVAPTSTGASAGGHGTLVVHLHNVNSDRETVRTFRREIGKEIFRFGPT